MYDLLILGAGPAGLTAAIYARRAGLSVCLTDKAFYGGQLAQTPEVENYPGIKSTEGFALAQAMYDQAEALGAEFASWPLDSCPSRAFGAASMCSSPILWRWWRRSPVCGRLASSLAAGSLCGNMSTTLPC